MGGLILEFEVVNDPSEPVIYPTTATSTDPAVFTQANCSNEWTISQVQIKCDMVSLD
jgi:hypothetical protein